LPVDKNFKKLISLMGPTASGKTDLAIRLRKKFPLEIISVDSAQVYRGFNIGTAKPDSNTLKEDPHRLIDIRNAGESYSVADFVHDANEAVNEIVSNGRVPILVGGSMLYFKSFLHGIDDLPKADKKIRELIEEKAKKEGWPSLHADLAKVDPVTANNLHPNHSNRIQRALEVYYQSGTPLSKLQNLSVGKSAIDLFSVLQIGLTIKDRSILYERIERRFENMIKEGLVEEVSELHAKGDLDLKSPASLLVGYRQLKEWCRGNLQLSDSISMSIKATKNLAKRQLTWLRGWDDLQSVSIDFDDRLLTIDELENKVSKMVEEHLLL
jgi:tRNA dimethylallyltransferase